MARTAQESCQKHQAFTERTQTWVKMIIIQYSTFSELFRDIQIGKQQNTTDMGV